MGKRSGFTLAETLMVVAITVTVAGMMLFSFSHYGSSEALAKDQARVVSVLEKARGMTLDSYNNRQYGVHFGTSTVTIFSGASYNSSDETNIVSTLNPKVQIKTTSFSGGGSSIIFNRLSGETNQSGTTTLSLINATTSTRTITIFRTGLIQPN